MQQNAIKRKLKSTLCGIASKRKRSNDSDLENSEDDEPTPPIYPKKSRRISMDILPKESGFLCVDNKVWPKLEDDQRKFIQKYNANICHSEDLGGLVASDGVTNAAVRTYPTTKVKTNQR